MSAIRNYTIILVKMKNASVVILSEYPNRSQLFLQDPKSDLFVLLKEKIYPLHKGFLEHVEYFKNPALAQEKVHVLVEHIDARWFEAVLGYFYGRPLEYERNWDLCNLMGTLQFLGVSVLDKKIHADMKNKFDQYGFFLLVQVAHRFKIKWLREMCQQELSLMNFQQLNYNRYDLFQIDRQTLESVLRFHELLKVNQNIVGQNFRMLRQIVSQYCKANKIDLCEVQNILLPQQSTIDQIKEEETQQTTIRKRNKSEPQNPLQKIQNDHLNKSMFTEPNLELNAKGDQNDELYKLRVLNCELSNQANRLLKEINKVKEVAEHQSDSKNCNIDQIDERFKKLEKMHQQQDEKLLNLKKEMLKLGAEQSSSPRSKSKSRASSQSSSSERVDKSPVQDKSINKTMLDGIPRLEKD